MQGLAHDIRSALRALRRAPLFGTIAIACLAAGIAVNAAAFSVLDAVLFRDLPGVERQHELTSVLIFRDEPRSRTSPSRISTADWDVFRGSIPAFASSSVVGSAPVALRLSGGAMAVRADFVSGDWFAMLGTRPAAGRLLNTGDDVPGAPPVAVIGHPLWESELGMRPDVVGQSVRVGDASFTIVGVAPRGFVGLNPGELTADPVHGAPWLILPVATAPLVRVASRAATAEAALDDRWLVLVGRRRPGVEASEVEAQARVVAAALAERHPRQRRNTSAVARPASTGSTAELIGLFAFTMAIPLVVLLVACANLANQLLARAVRRRREIAVRLSLGATRARLVRMLLVESAILAIAASVAGLVLARLLTDALGAFVLVIPFRIPMDARVGLFTIGLASLTVLAFGLVPALRATRLDLAQTMKEGGGQGGHGRSRLRSGLVVAQVAASIALLTLTGVLIRGSQRSRISENAENFDRVLTIAVDLDLLGYSPAGGRELQTSIMDRLRGLPAVTAVAMSPVTAIGWIPDARVALPGDPPDRERWYDVAPVTGDWFTARGIRPLSGRVFTAAEANARSAVAVVDEAAARRLWPADNPLGKSLRIGQGDEAAIATVVGLVPTVRDPHGHNDDGVIFVPGAGRYDARSTFYVRTRGNAADLAAPARALIRDLDPRLPAATVRTLGEALDELGATATQMASAAGAMGGIALLLAALGLSTVLSFIVEQRRREIGIRMAVGARPAAVTWMVVRQSLQLSLIGIALGAAVAGAVATLLRGILFGLPPLDPISFSAAAAALVIVTLLSSAAPASRAAAVDPMVSLRAE
jgi:predicted permease